VLAVRFLSIAALHFLRPDVNPVLEPISNYGVGPHGFLLTVADIGSVLATLALVVGLYLGMTPSTWNYVGLFLPGLYGVSELLAGTFPIMSAQKLRRSAGSIILSAIYRSFAFLSPQSFCLWAWIMTSGGELFGVPHLRCQLLSS
jgi:Protein of unknown function (DUF998)